MGYLSSASANSTSLGAFDSVPQRSSPITSASGCAEVPVGAWEISIFWRFRTATEFIPPFRLARTIFVGRDIVSEDVKCEYVGMRYAAKSRYGIDPPLSDNESLIGTV